MAHKSEVASPLSNTAPSRRWRYILQAMWNGLLWATVGWAFCYMWWPLVFLALVPFSRLVLCEDRLSVALSVVWFWGTLYFGAVEYWFALYSPVAWITLAAL